MRHKLLVIHASHCVEVGFDQQLTIGRDVYNALCLQDPEVSRSHAIIFEQDPDVVVKDLKSRNGLYTNGEKSVEHLLAPGDELIVGATVMFFDPSPEMDLEKAMTKRARYLVEKRVQSDRLAQAADPVTICSCADMDAAIGKMLAGEEQSELLSVAHAVQLLQAFKTLDDSSDAKELFERALDQALTIMGGDRGLVAESSVDKKSFKTLADRERAKLSTPAIDDAILRKAWDFQKCMFSAAATREGRFTVGPAQGSRVAYTFVVAPVRAAGEVVAVIALEAEDPSVSYDLSALRALWLIATHVGALLRPRLIHAGRPTMGVVAMRT
jgi:hypothetical protein